MKNWSCLEFLLEKESITLEYEHGYYGKANLARTDFRWLAQSKGFQAKAADLNIGLENQIEAEEDTFYWRSTDTHFFAIYGYRSNTVDASRREGALEKYILQVEKDKNLPTALIAFTLFSVFNTNVKHYWRNATEDSKWKDDPNFIKSLEPDSKVITITDLENYIKNGIESLEQSISKKQILTAFYIEFFSNHPLAILDNKKSLSAYALASLLLPLEETNATHFSLAGWLPSSRVEIKQLKNWQGIVCPLKQIERDITKFTDKDIQQKANRITSALLNQDPSKLSFEQENIKPEPKSIVDLCPNPFNGIIAIPKEEKYNNNEKYNALYNWVADLNKRNIAKLIEIKEYFIENNILDKTIIQDWCDILGNIKELQHEEWQAKVVAIQDLISS